MARHVHLLKPNKRCETPHAALWFDTETHQDIDDDGTITHRLNFGWANASRTLKGGQWSSGHWCRFSSKGAFYDFVEESTRPRVTLWCFCHNTNFDLPVLDLFNELPERGWDMTMAVIEGPPTIIKFRKGDRQLVFLDTLNFWRMPLRDIGTMVGLPKLDMPTPEASIEEWDVYGKRDVEVLRKACIEWWQFLVAEDLGGFANTLAGQALRTFRHRFMSHKILIDANEKALAISRAAYVGGRTECFRIGKIPGRVTTLDFNSMYPYVMEDMEYPTVLRGVWKRVTHEELARTLKRYCVCAEVEIETDEPIYPFRQADRLVFPVGRFRTHLSSPELIHALANGHLRTVHVAAVYERAPIFKDFVRHMYTHRLEAKSMGDEARSWMFKILMNSLYGKFGQRGFVFEEEARTHDLSAKTWVEVDADTGKRYRYRQLGGIVQCCSDEKESRESHPAIAAHVCAEARMALWRVIKEAGNRNVFYCDTDCVWVNDEGLSRLTKYIDPSRLGALKLEHQARGVVIHGPKDYVLGTTSKTKGVKKSAIWLRPGVIEQERWSSLKGLLALGRLDKPTTKPVEKRLARRYLKGVVGAFGWVSPFDAGSLEGVPGVSMGICTRDKAP